MQKTCRSIENGKYQEICELRDVLHALMFTRQAAKQDRCKESHARQVVQDKQE
jgi:hypothetical protein